MTVSSLVKDLDGRDVSTSGRYSNFRGRHVAIGGNLIAFAIVIAYYYNIGLSYTTSPAQWRALIASQGAIILAQIAWTALLSESPRWHIKHVSFLKSHNKRC